MITRRCEGGQAGGRGLGLNGDLREVMPMTPVALRLADFNDVPSIQALQKESLRTLSRGFYDESQVQSFLRFVPTLETQIICDATYFVAEQAGRIVGCGGWSQRTPAYQSSRFNPLPGAGPQPKVRAMYVDPGMARRGIGRALLAHVEQDIRHHGHKEVSLDAVLPGVPLYSACGYRAVANTDLLLPDGVRMSVISMHKSLA
jgi:GNAT superfamily N-acetyltransferase